MAEVKLHAYALSEQLGWHLGVQIYDQEYYFDGFTDFKGVLVLDRPGTWAGKTSEVTDLGVVNRSREEVQGIIDHLRDKEYTAGASLSSKTTYSIMFHNCQDFAQSFINHLGCEMVPKKYVKALSRLRLGMAVLSAPTPSNVSAVLHRARARTQRRGRGLEEENLVTVRLEAVPEGWGVHVKTYRSHDRWHAKSYWHEWLQVGEKRMSAGQSPDEEFTIVMVDGSHKCLTGDHKCMAGDLLVVSYAGRWNVAHFRNGERLYDRQSVS